MSDEAPWMLMPVSLKTEGRRLAAVPGKVLRCSGNLLFLSSLLPSYVQKTCCCDGCSMFTVSWVDVSELI